uniref:Protein kinase domain-containing protein n=1 Tax=Compsopogon caeruleus TaxID=31354 RepID=A0A7S1TDK2_9RHOD|mmetsp:Transcript_2250/g.3855  ORF Transcript_2250/g.3855 Transcript_2250/m.3855 type:complete len:446 (+) Transcript_2250:1981-3318(+)|eukprot:CAMPEP_0184678036 /NCGR_PEP_ID=MMETSP0312-20130426/661_1 /TAXON_ID=31354 /ORGANISM="Compsopogon coeruleus, Strain SAG 36.94" /LENGTH=445 /DNA_ID=CAMNT_0027126353 /DNA_START=1954 /DNA_END=3291 /DNA_ORIENTATION=-
MGHQESESSTPCRRKQFRSQLPEIVPRLRRGTWRPKNSLLADSDELTNEEGADEAMQNLTTRPSDSPSGIRRNTTPNDREMDVRSRNNNAFSQFSEEIIHPSIDPSFDDLDIRMEEQIRQESAVLKGQSSPKSHMMDKEKTDILEELTMSYRLGEFLGAGNSAAVYMGYDLQDQKAVAIKMIDVSPDDEETQTIVRRETEFAKAHFCHCRLVQTKAVFRIRRMFFVVMDFMAGGTLESLLDHTGKQPENVCRIIIRQVLEGLEFLHQNDVVHRDVKPANIIFETHTSLSVRISDFGLSERLKLDEKGKKRATGAYGTPFYVAPEVAKEMRYDCRADVWSCGILMFEMLSGNRPFDGTDPSEIIRKVKRGVIKFSDPIWSHVSSDAKSLLRKLTNPDFKKRIGASEALEHKWFTSGLDCRASNDPAVKFAAIAATMEGGFAQDLLF